MGLVAVSLESQQGRGSWLAPKHGEFSTLGWQFSSDDGDRERGRTEPDLSGGEPLDDPHPPAAEGAGRHRERMFGGQSRECRL